MIVKRNLQNISLIKKSLPQSRKLLYSNIKLHSYNLKQQHGCMTEKSAKGLYKVK